MTLNKNQLKYTLLAFSFIILYILFPCHLTAKGPEEVVFQRAEEVFESGNYLIAVKRFQSFISKYPSSDLVPQAKLLMAACYLKSGNLTEAVRIYASIVETCSEREYITKAVKALGTTRSKDAKKYLESKLETRDIRLREVVAEALGIIGNRKTAQKLMKVLEKEQETGIQEKILTSISRIEGKSIKFKSMIAMFKKGSNNLKINIINLLASIRKNYVINFLQEQLETSSAELRPYLVRAMAKIDPYTYGVRIEGTIVKTKGAWFIKSKKGIKHELARPGTESIEEKELAEFLNKKVIVFGGKHNGRILYTEIYK